MTTSRISHLFSSQLRVPEEVLGWFIVATLYRRFTSMVIPCNQLLGGGVGMLGITRVVAPGKSRSSESNMHHDYDVTHRVNVTTPHFDSIRDRRSRASRGEVDSGAEGQDRGGLVQSSIEDEATNISSNFFSSGAVRKEMNIEENLMCYWDRDSCNIDGR